MEQMSEKKLEIKLVGETKNDYEKIKVEYYLKFRDSNEKNFTKAAIFSSDSLAWELAQEFYLEKNLITQELKHLRDEIAEKAKELGIEFSYGKFLVPKRREAAIQLHSLVSQSVKEFFKKLKELERERGLRGWLKKELVETINVNLYDEEEKHISSTEKDREKNKKHFKIKR